MDSIFSIFPSKREIEKFSGDVHWHGFPRIGLKAWFVTGFIAATAGLAISCILPFVGRNNNEYFSFPPPAELVFYCAAGACLIAVLLLATQVGRGHLWITQQGILVGGIFSRSKVTFLPLGGIDSGSVHLHHHSPRVRRHFRRLSEFPDLANHYSPFSSTITLVIRSEIALFARDGKPVGGLSTPGWFYFEGSDPAMVAAVMRTASKAKRPTEEQLRALPAEWATTAGASVVAEKKCALCRVDRLLAKKPERKLGWLVDWL